MDIAIKSVQNVILALLTACILGLSTWVMNTNAATQVQTEQIQNLNTLILEARTEYIKKSEMRTSLQLLSTLMETTNSDHNKILKIEGKVASIERNSDRRDRVTEKLAEAVNNLALQIKEQQGINTAVLQLLEDR